MEYGLGYELTVKSGTDIKGEKGTWEQIEKDLELNRYGKTYKVDRWKRVA